MKKKILVLAFAGALAIGALTVAFASPTYSLFGDASIVAPGNASGHAAALTSDATSPGYGGVELVGVPSARSAITALSFDYNANVTGDSGGSPRLVVSFSDGGNAQLRPLSLTANTWVTINGMTGNDWDNSGGCGDSYATTWTAVVACHSTASIDGMWVVNDSSWMYTDGIVVQVDNITVNADVITFEPVVVVAATKDQCKNNGWKAVVDSNGNSFKNQGDCVSFVATNGKNTGAIAP